MRRLKNRGEMNEDEFRRRLNSSLSEYDYAIKSEQFIFLINDMLPKAVDELKNIVKNACADDNLQREGKDLAIKLKNEVKNLLSTLD
jgi:guanylate kinase